MGDGPERDLSPDDVQDAMDVLEPYTTGELSSYFDAPKQLLRELLDHLASAGEIRKKEPERGRTIWIREAPAHECPDCGFRYEVKPLHPVLSGVRFCPRCGTQLK